MEMNWPVLMFSRSEKTLSGIQRNQSWNRLGIKRGVRDVYFLDSSGLKYTCESVVRKNIIWKNWPDILFLNPTYEVDYNVILDKKNGPRFLQE